jgi:acylphosphatase
MDRDNYDNAVPADPLDLPADNGKQAQVEGVNTYAVRVTGRVQGVFFRDFVKRTADSLQVCGWVRNEPDGSVRAVLQSPETRILELMLERLRQGPPAAEVEEVYVEQLAGEERCDGFEIRR